MEDETDRHRSWNATTTVYERDASVADVFLARVAETPEAIAIETSDRSLSYRELAVKSERVALRTASAIEKQVAKGGQPYVAVLADRSAEAVIAFLGVIRAGAAYVPIDPDLPAARLRTILEDSGSCALLYESRLADRLAELSAVELISIEDAIDTDAPVHGRPAMPSGRSPIYVMYTSGSTGRPKGVVVEHRGVLRYTRGAEGLIPNSTDGVLFVNQLGFDASTYEIWAALTNGARLVIHPPGRPEPGEVARTIQEGSVSVAFFATALFHQMVDAAPPVLSGLRLVIVGGDVMSPGHADRFVKMHPGCRLINAYGPTETTVSASYHEVHQLVVGQSVPIGRPLHNTTLYILDDQKRWTPDGEPGELYIGGDGVAKGYLNLPELTDESFVPNPFEDGGGDRLYRSGDQVRLRDDGELEFLGRLDQQVKIRGYRVEPSEVEALLSGCPGVTQAVVVAREDIPGHKRLVSYATTDASVDVDQIRRYLRTRLPEYMVPSAIVVLDRLPLTSQGKVDRVALPPPMRSGSRTDLGTPPTTDTELEVALVWAEVLLVEDVFFEDDFFEAGGDSLLALALLSGLRQRLSIELPIALVFEERSFGAIAARIEHARSGSDAVAPLPAIALSGREEPIRVSPSQEQVLFLSGLAEDSLPYQSQATIWLEGVLDETSLENALNTIVARHEILRTALVASDGTWILRVAPHVTVSLPLVDVSTAADPKEAFLAIRSRQFGRKINVEEAPLIRWMLIRLSPTLHALLQIEHHAIHDGASFVTLLGEITSLYRALTEGTKEILPSPQRQYRDFARWQRAFSRTRQGEVQLEYWKSRLHDAPVPTPILNTRRSTPFTFRGSSIRIPIDPELFERLRRLGARSGCTPYMVMLSAFFALLHLYTGDMDLLIGSGLANRRVRGAESLVGMTVNTVVLRMNMEGDPSIEELLERAREICLEALGAQEIPFEEVVKSIAPHRGGRASPFHDCLFSFHDSPLPNLELKDLRVIPEDTLSNGSAKADLNVVVINRRGHVAPLDPEGDQGSHMNAAEARSTGDVTLVWEYCTDVFDDAAAERMLRHYVHILSQVVEDPTRKLSDMHLATEGERKDLLSAGHNTSSYEREASVCDVFAARVRENPSGIALVCGTTKVSYAELDHEAELLAWELRAKGVGRGSCVGVVDDRSPAMVIALLGILRAGGAYVGIDPSVPTSRLATLIEAATIRTICLSTSARLSAVEELAGSALLVRVDPAGAKRMPSKPDVAAEPFPLVKAMDLAYVSFTSGSTGKPKGVEILHRGVVSLVRGTDYVEIGKRDRLLGMAPLSFDASTFEIWGALLNGARLVLAPAGPLSTDETATVISRNGITVAWFSSAILNQMVEHELDTLTGVRQIIAGGDVLSPAHVNQLLRVLPEGGVLVNGYGPTEATTFACCHRMAAGSYITGPVPIGTAIANTTVYVLDSSMELCPIGLAGELFIGGDGVARGYLGHPELTAERFGPDPFSDDIEGRLYRTGDLAKWTADGVIQFLGRVDRQVKIRGFRVEPAEVEAAIVRHPAVVDAVVTPWNWGPDDKRLIAHVRARFPSGSNADEVGARGATDDELRRFLVDRLPSYMVPNTYIWLDEFPLTTGGKIDFDKLPEPSSAWAPPEVINDDHSVSRSMFGSASSASRLELKLMMLWQEVLGVRPIGLYDNFFDLGGHSLLAVALFADIDRATGARLPLATIFEAPTIAELASVLRRGGWEGGWGSLVPLTTTGTRTPIFCVTAGDGNAVGFGPLARRLGPEQPFYALQPRGLDGRVPFHHSVQAMAAHYVRQVRTIQKNGPYVLAGRCFGTLVAYEMTLRLEAAGETIALLIALDSIGPYWRLRRLANDIPYDEVMNLARLRADFADEQMGDIFADPSSANRFIAWLLQPMSQSGDRQINRYLHTAYLFRDDLRAAYSLENNGHAGLAYWSWAGGRSEMGMNPALLPVPSDDARRARPSHDPRHATRFKRARAFLVDWADVVTRGRIPPLVARRQDRLLEIATRTVLRYRGGACAAPVALIRSAEYRNDLQLARWFGLETGGIRERFVAGTHQSMVREPDVESLASTIEQLITEADTKPIERTHLHGAGGVFHAG